MGGNIPDGNFLGGNFPGGIFQGGNHVRNITQKIIINDGRFLISVMDAPM